MTEHYTARWSDDPIPADWPSEAQATANISDALLEAEQRQHDLEDAAALELGRALLKQPAGPADRQRLVFTISDRQDAVRVLAAMKAAGYLP